VEVWQRGDVILDLYEVLDVVRTGGMGLVYRVRHRGWDIDLAVKTPRKALVSSPTAVRNFQAEAEAWVGLGLHPHIANCVYVRTLDGAPRVFAEWADGGSLAEAIRCRTLYRDSALGPVLDVAIQSAWGLDHAHEQHLVHQDVKPANVMLMLDGTVKVTDFGMARARAAAGERAANGQETSPLVSYGGLTPAYCSPEQAAGPVRLTRSTDVWSWAVTVFEMFAGSPPCQDGSLAGEVFAEFVRAGAQAPNLPAVPSGVINLLSRCFTTDPAARPSQLGPLADELAELYEREVGPYRRRTPVAATLLADGLSNHALAMLDLGRPDSAEELWKRALQADPHHPQSRYNRGLHRWRTGKITDTELVNELETVRFSHADEWMDEHLLGLVHRERGDLDSALTLLREVAERAPNDPDVTAALISVEHAPATKPPMLFKGHQAEVRAVALTPDGRIAVSGDAEGTFCVWDIPKGQCRNSFQLDGYRIGSIALRPDGRIAVVGGDVRTALVVDLESGQYQELSGHSSWVSLVALMQDGRHAITHGHDGATITWDVATGRQTGVRHADKAANALGAQGTLCANVDYNRGRLTIHDLRTGELLHTLEGRNTAVVISDEGSVALTTHGDTSARMFDLTTGKAVRFLDIGYARIGLSADGSTAFSDSAKAQQARLWELRTGRCRLTVGGADNVNAVALSHDGQVVVTAEGNTIRLRRIPPAGPPAPWSYLRPRPAAEIAEDAEQATAALATAARLADNGRFREAAAEVRAARALPGHRRHAALVEQWRQLGRHGSRTELIDVWPAGQIVLRQHRSWALAFSGRSPTVVARNGNDGEAWVFDVETGLLLYTLSLHAGNVNGIALSADGSLAVSGGEDGRVIAWEPRQGRIVQLFNSPSDRVYNVALSEDGRAALSGTADGVVNAWDIGAGRHIGRWQGHVGPVLSVAVSAEGRFGLSRGQDECVNIWELRPARLRHTLRGHDGWIGTARLSIDAQYVITGGADATVRIWRTSSGQNHIVLSGHTDAVVDAIMSPDGRWALSCSVDGTVRLWDLGNRRCRHVLDGHTGPVLSLAATPDFSLAASGGEDRTVRLWNLTNGTRLQTFDSHVAEVAKVALSDDGSLLLSSSPSGHLRTWALDWEYDFPATTAKVARTEKAELRELRDEVAVRLPSRSDHRPGLIEVLSRYGDRHQRAITGILELAAELSKVYGRTETAHKLYVMEEARRREPRSGTQEPTVAEGLALLLRPEAELSRSEAFWAELFSSGLQDNLALLTETAPLLQRDGELDAAEQTWQLILDVRSQLWDIAHTDTQTALLGLSSVLVDLRREAEALTFVRSVRDQRSRDFGLDHPATLEAASRLASVLLSAGALREAERIHRDTIPLLQRRYGSDDSRTLAAWTDLAVVLRRSGRLRRAEPILRSVLAKRQRRLGDDHPATLSARIKLTAVLFDRKRRREAESHLRGVITNWKQDRAPDLLAQITDCTNHPHRRRPR
jgi:WD40 repeat protein